MMLMSLRSAFGGAFGGLLALASAVSAVSSLASNTTAEPTTTSTITQFSTLFSTVRATTHSPSSIATPADVCCFVVQDTVREDYWVQYTTTTQYQVVNLTSITTLVTPYPTVTSTNYETNVYTTNATFLFSDTLKVNPVSLYVNASPGPAEAISILNGTKIVTGGVTVASPTAFYVYSTVKIITAPAVTDSDGNVACATLSAFPSVVSAISFSTSSFIESTVSITETVTTTLYSTLDSSSFLTPTATYTTVITYRYPVTGQTEISEGSYVYTKTDEPTFTYVNEYAEAYFGNSSTTPTGVIISLTTPFVYLPSRGAQGASTGFPNLCAQSPGGSVDFGYTPQTLVDFLAANAFYSSQYPGLASCLPGGPSVGLISVCSQVSPETETAGGDLTSSTVITITPSGIKAPSTQPVSTTVTAIPVTSSTTPVPESTTPVPESTTPVPESSTPASGSPTPAPESSAPAPESSAPASISPTPTVPISEPAPAPSSIPAASQPVVTPSTPAPAPSQESSTPVPPPSEPSSPPIIVPQPGTSLPANSPTSAQIPGGSNVVVPLPVSSSNIQPQGPDTSNGIVPVPASSPPTPQNPAPEPTLSAQGSVIASIIGAQPLTGSPTVIGGISQIIVSGATTIPVNPALPLSGLTTVISGTTNVIVSAATTVPISEIVPSIPGSATPVSGTSNVGIPGGTTSSPAPIQASSANEMAVRWYSMGMTVLFSSLALL